MPHQLTQRYDDGVFFSLIDESLLFPGGDNNLRVIMSAYNPVNVRCYGQMRTPDVLRSCQAILDSMRTNDQEILFGPEGEELDVDVALPFLLISGECGSFILKKDL